MFLSFKCIVFCLLLSIINSRLRVKNNNNQNKFEANFYLYFKTQPLVIALSAAAVPLVVLF
jgi:hypothetical protein